MNAGPDHNRARPQDNVVSGHIFVIEAGIAPGTDASTG